MVPMGWCHEFGVTVREDCGHPMRAAESACQCPECGVVCEGQFAGCATVWELGPREVVLVRPEAADPRFPSARNADDLPPLGGVNGEDPSSQTLPPISNGGDGDLQPESGPPVLAAEEARAHVFDFLKDSFEGLDAQVRVLADAVNRQQQTLSDMAEAREAAVQLSALAADLPERVGAAVREAVTAGQRSDAEVAERSMRHEVADQEMTTLRPHNGSDQTHTAKREPAAVEPAAVVPVQPAAVQPVVTQPEMEHASAVVTAEDDDDRAGVRSQLNDLASSLQSAVTRSGWQEKLRSLSTR